MAASTGRPVVAQRARLLEAAADLGPAGGQRLAQQGEHLGARRLGAGRQVLDQLGQGILQRAATDDRAAVGDVNRREWPLRADTTGPEEAKIGP